ncbi:MAG: biosynthetic arginine decarboxylase [Bdellovibrionales bacterium]|nr:biosynthetic arginine decarboxylase [Bdellovibrionales bacterium]
MKDWNLEKAKELYGLSTWGNGYFDVNEKGNVIVAPYGPQNEHVDLLELTEDLQERGIRCPMLIRFPDIIKERIRLINTCFQKAMESMDYKGTYQGVYPIKVNQQKHLIDEVVRVGNEFHLGLECGSKPELLVVLAKTEDPQALILCNGFKDQEYIETAILSRKLGKNTIVVVERLEELDLIIKACKKFDAKPKIGLRAKLQSKASGRWVDSGGARSKFGLTTSEIFRAFEILKKENIVDCLDLIHFHIGSQIPNIKTIKNSLKEGAQVYSELCRLGANPTYLDVGGGLGVDYDGSSSTDSSVNYSVQEYANDVVSIIQGVCEEKSVRTPNIVTEAGRALVAHHSLLIFDVLGLNKVEKVDAPPAVDKNEHKVLLELKYIYETLDVQNVNEYFHDLMDLHENSLQLFTFGLLSLAEKAKIEQYFWSIATRMLDLTRGEDDHVDLYEELKILLSDTYFCNFSVFQSLPDSWAVGHMFPVIPIHRLNEKPEQEATLVDLTCDSDGKIAKFIDVETGEAQNTLSVHPFIKDKPYYLGVFLVGAYQEILGDLHNLFGDTDAVHVSINEQGYTVDDVVEGDTVGEVLSYVQYNLEELVQQVRRAAEGSILEGQMTKAEARTLMRYYQEGLAGYTYLEEPEA